MLGGYKIINLQNKNITTQASIKIDGIYETVESTKKPVLVENITINDFEKKPLFVQVNEDGGNYVFEAYGYHFTIMDDDTIILQNE